MYCRSSTAGRGAFPTTSSIAGAANRREPSSAGVKEAYADIPIIGFPRGCGASAERYAQETKIDAIGCDTSMPLAYINETLQGRLTVQGNLDPLLLVAGGAHLERRVQEILDLLSGGPFVFNLGHGIVPETPPEHVAKLVDLVKDRWARAGTRDAPPLRQGLPRHRHHRLDGGSALSAPALRLSRRGAEGLGAVRDLQDHGAASVARHHHAGDDRELGAWAVSSPSQAR